MDFITDITKLLRHYSPQTDGSFLPEGKLRKLFHLIVSEQATTDQQAVRLLYGPGTRPEEKKFLMLKKEFEDRLTNQLLQQSIQTNVPLSGKETWDSIPHLKLWCRRQMILAEMLLTHQLHQHAEKILLKVSKQAQKLLFYHILEESCLLLRQVYMLKGNIKSIALYDEKVAVLQQKNQRINQASGWYEHLQVQANSTIARSKSLHEQAHHYATAITEWLNETYDPLLGFYYYRICTIEYTSCPDTEALQALIKKKAAFIKKHKRFRNLTHLAEINLNRIYLCQAKGSLRSARRYAEHGLTFHNLPWNLLLSLQEKAFIIYLRLGDYPRAEEILRQVTRTPQAQLLTPFQASQWYLKEAYLHYASTHDSATEVGSFANSVSLPEFDRQTAPLAVDKKGYQVQVLILKTLLLYQKGKGDLTYHAKSLRMYYQRHLTDLEDTKTKLFFQMMIKAVAVNFDQKRTLKRTLDLVEELERIPQTFQEKQELIPYGKLWQIINRTH